MRAAGCSAGGGPLSAAVAATREEMVAKDSQLHLSTSVIKMSKKIVFLGKTNQKSFHPSKG